MNLTVQPPKDVVLLEGIHVLQMNMVNLILDIEWKCLLILMVSL